MYHNQIINDYIIIKYNNNLKKLTDIHTINQSNCSYVNEVLISDIILWWNWMTFSIQIFQESRKKFKRIRRIEIWMECVCKCVSVWVCEEENPPQGKCIFQKISTRNIFRWILCVILSKQFR